MTGPRLRCQKQPNIESHVANRHLLFEAGGLALAAPADLVKTVHEELAVQKVAGTVEWFRGLAVAHGKLLPVTDLGAFCGRRSSTGHTLELTETAGSSGLQVDSVLGLSETAVSELPLDKEASVRAGSDRLPLTSRVIVEGTRVHRVLDLAALLNSTAFLTISDTCN